MGVSRDAKAHFDRALRAELRAQRKALDEFVKQILENRKAAIVKARHLCASSKQRAKVRATRIREAAKVEAQSVMQAAKTSCQRGRDRAKRVGEKELRAAGATRKQALADERTVLRSKRRKEPKPRGRREQLDEVRADIPAELLPVFESVKGQLKPHARKSLSETFLEWAEANPEEVSAFMVGTPADAMLADAMREQKSVDRALRSRKQLRADDWAVIGTSPAELQAVGLDPNDPEDVLAFLGGYTQHWRDKTREAVPF